MGTSIPSQNIKELWFKACLCNDFESLLSVDWGSVKTWPRWHAQDAWIKGVSLATQREHVDFLKKVWTSKSLKMFRDQASLNMEQSIQSQFNMACREGKLKSVQFWSTSSALKNNGYALADPRGDGHEGFLMACSGNQVEVVHYLLTSQDLEKANRQKAELTFYGAAGLIEACQWGALEVVQYLLTSKELHETWSTHVDVHAQEDEALKAACLFNQWDVVKWLVLDFGLDRNPNVQELEELHPDLKEWMRARLEKEEIQKTIKMDQESMKKLLKL